MLISKCDLCKKEVKEPIVAGFGFSRRVELCSKCGMHIIKFLKKHKLIDVKRYNY